MELWQGDEEAHQLVVIAMDQRNAGRSRAPITENDGWDDYTAEAARLERETDRFRVFETSTLNDPAGVAAILRFAGVGEGAEVVAGIHLNGLVPSRPKPRRERTG